MTYFDNFDILRNIFSKHINILNMYHIVFLISAYYTIKNKNLNKWYTYKFNLMLHLLSKISI